MRYVLGLFFLLFVVIGISAQNSPPSTEPSQAKAKPKPTPANPSRQTKKSGGKATQTATQKNPGSAKTKTATPKVLPEGEAYGKAASIEEPEQQVAALKRFLEKYPSSIRRAGVLESIAITRIKLAQDKLTAAETESGIELLKLAMKELPTPVPAKLYEDSISKIPTDLFNNGQRAGAIEIASIIKEKIGDNPAQLLSLANFFLMTENGAEARSLAEKALATAPSSAAYQTLGLANRLNFQLDEASQAYAKALELEPDSPVVVRSLADLKRAQGKSDEAGDLYRKILEKDAANVPAQTGLVLSLFDSGKTADAEAALAKSLEENPGNVILLAGSAYWYAAHGNPDKAIEFALKAIEKEPRYIWSHIALAHGYLAEKSPAEAEKVLLKARVFGNFPTLEYEIASARLMSGYYRDAVEELNKSFTVKDGVIHVKLGGRVDSDQSSFVDLLAAERRASIFEPESADDRETASRLKSLMEFDQAVNMAQPTEETAVKAAVAFMAGDDKMKLHRQLYAASSLLNKDIALDTVSEVAQSAVGNTDTALDVPDPSAAVMASELYESRSLLLMRNEFLEVPLVPKTTLSAILRGRVEELAGWTLFNQNKPHEAVVRLRRAVSVMPAKSAWWRSSMWRLGAALQADGKDAEALDSYIKSYSIDKPSAGRYAVVESLYRKVHGNTEGLEAKIGISPTPVAGKVPNSTAVAKVESLPDAPPSSRAGTDGSAKPSPTLTQGMSAAATPDNVPITAASPTPTPAPTIEPIPSPTAEAAPVATPTPAAVEPTPLPTVEVIPTPTPTPAMAEPTPSPTVEAAPEAVPTPTPTIVEPTPSPTPTAAVVELSSTPEPSLAAAAATPSPTPEPTPTPAVTDATQKTDSAGKTKIVDIRPADPSGQVKTLTKQPDSSSIAKQLFEPIIITIPKPEAPKRADTATDKKIDEPPTDPDKERTGTDANDKQSAEKTADSGDVRPRVIDGKTSEVPEQPPCSINVSQDAISILNNGGSLGILLRMEGPGELKNIKAVSNSPDDLDIILEPEIAGVKGQSFYVIRSMTRKTGDFTIAFIAPCGRKEISVNVR